MRERSVDFPDPDGPMIATVSPGAMVRSISERIVTAPLPLDKATWTSSSLTTGFAGDEFKKAANAGRLRLKTYGPKRRGFNRVLLTLATLTMLVRPAAADPVKILALGDSLTAGLGLALDDSFPTRLQAALVKDGHDVTVINAGVSGDTSAGGLARLDWALADHPRLALVELGANDALRGLDPANTRSNLDQILAKLTAAGVKPILLGMKAPKNWGVAYDHAFDEIYPELAAKYKVPLYPFFLEGVALDPKFTQPDGMHPNPEGVMVIVAHVLPVVERALTP